MIVYPRTRNHICTRQEEAMWRMVGVVVLALVTLGALPAQAQPVQAQRETVRFATFNASLNRNSAGQLLVDLSTPNNVQARTVAEIIQRLNPDVLLINEFDYYSNNAAA